MAKHFMRGILPKKEFLNIFCFNEDTADAVDDFVDANRRNKGEDIVFPQGESYDILNNFLARVKDQIGLVKRFRENTFSQKKDISSVSVNTGWAYNVGMAWDEDFDRALYSGNPKAVLTFCKALSVECNKLDELKDKFEEQRNRRDNNGE